MKLPAKLVVPIFLLGLIRDVVPSNPDSEIVQDPAKASTGAGTNEWQYRRPASRPSIALELSRFAGTSRFASTSRLSQPYATDVIVREAVGLSFGRNGISDTRYWNVLHPDIIRVDRNNNTQFFVPPERIRLNPFDIIPPTMTMIPSTTTVRSGYEGGTRTTGAGIFGSPFNDGGRRPRPRPSILGNSNFRTASRSGANANDENRRTPVPNGYVTPDRDIGRETTRPSGGNRAPPPPSNPRGTSGDGTPSTTNKKISADANLFAGIVNDFAFKLMESLNLQSNFVISPMSIFVALSMCYLGAEGKTKAQLEQVLGLNEYAVHGVHLHQGISDLVSMFSSGSREYQLFFANGMFLGRNFTVEEPFKEDLQKYYGAELKNLDFGNQEISLRTINEWVAKNTRNTIERISDSPLPTFTRLVLLNAIFFKGIWQTQFPRHLTKNDKFFTLDGNEKEVPFMNLFRESFPILRSDEHRHAFIKLPYQGDQVSMIIALPYGREEPPMPSTTDQILCHVRDAMVKMQLGTVSIPKFRLEYLESLKEPLMHLGIRDIFDSSVNMTKMRKLNDVFVSNILHKAVIDVNEEGTTASAATTVQLVPYTSLRNDFLANHPFAFYIVHEDSGLVLFYGKVYDLEEGTEEPASNGRGNNVPPSSNRNRPQVAPGNGRDSNYGQPTNDRNNPQVPPGNGRDYNYGQPTNDRNNPQVPPGNGRDNNYGQPTNDRNNPQVPQNNGRDDNYAPPSNSRNRPQIPPRYGRDDTYLPPTNDRNNPQVPPSNERENIQAQSSNNRNSPLDPSRWESPQFPTNYRRENVQAAPRW